MSVWSILLRVLLTVGLILNGSSYAVASAHMQHMTMASATPQPVATPVAAVESPCAERHQGMVPVAGNPLPDAASDAVSVESEHPAPDCCKSGTCRCACVHHSQAAVPAVAFRQAVIEHVSSVRSMKSGHDSPALPHLIRPPIG